MVKELLVLGIITVVFSCGGTMENKEVEIDDFTDDAEVAGIDSLNEDKNGNPALFVEYYEKCQALTDGLSSSEDASSLRAAAFDPKYNRPDPEGAIDWDVIKALWVGEDLISMHIASWFEDVTNHYLVVLDSSGWVHQFNFIGSSNDAVIELNPISNSPDVRVTKRLGYTIHQGETYDPMSVSNFHFQFSDKVYVEEGPLTEVIEFNENFTLIGEDDEYEFNLYYHYWDNGPFQCDMDIYLGEEFFSRLPRHEANNWSVEEAHGIQVADFNNDGKDDLLITIDAVSGVGPEGMIPFPVHCIYFFKDYQGFITIQEINDQLKLDLQPLEEIKTICKEVKL